VIHAEALLLLSYQKKKTKLLEMTFQVFGLKGLVGTYVVTYHTGF